MTIRVEATWSGGDRFGFRLTAPNGDREQLTGFRWDRRLASKALDLYEHVYGFKRRSIRFFVH